jgi:hypothetical protein
MIAGDQRRSNYWTAMGGRIQAIFYTGLRSNKAIAASCMRGQTGASGFAEVVLYLQHRAYVSGEYLNITGPCSTYFG